MGISFPLRELLPRDFLDICSDGRAGTQPWFGEEAQKGRALNSNTEKIKFLAEAEEDGEGWRQIWETSALVSVLGVHRTDGRGLFITHNRQS